jgi:predicted DNA-binding protein
MIQKHISLPEELDQQIRERVKRLNRPEEQVITQLIEEGLKTPKQWKNAGDALSSLSELGIKGPKDLARNHDKYLYEDE